MKIRTDFVTNSSSSSFVSYNLHDSEFCRYVYEQMQKQGLEYEESSYDLPKSHVSFHEDSLDADICCLDEELCCDMYAPECWRWNGSFSMKLEDIEECLEDSAKETFKQILDEELKGKSFDELLDEIEDWDDLYELRHEIEDWADDYTWEKYHSDYYRAKKISDHGDFHLCSRLFALLSDCKYDEDYIQKQDDMIHIIKYTYDDEMDFIDLFSDHLYAATFDGYTSCDKEEDIYTMTGRFLGIISGFIPVDSVEDYKKAEELFEKDRKNGKFSCDVYMGSTD